MPQILDVDFKVISKGPRRRATELGAPVTPAPFWDAARIGATYAASLWLVSLAVLAWAIAGKLA